MITQFAKLLLVSHCHKPGQRDLQVGAVAMTCCWCESDGRLSGGGWEEGATLYLIIRVEDDLRRVERCHKHKHVTRSDCYPQLLLAASPLTWCPVCGVKCGVNPNPTINSLLSTILHLFSTTTAMAALSLATDAGTFSTGYMKMKICEIYPEFDCIFFF